METIKFYGVKDEYGCFSNFSKHPVIIASALWPTSEHYYQAQKFYTKERREEIRNLEHPMDTKRFVQHHRSEVREDWNFIKDAIMEFVVGIKFYQNKDIQHILFSTNNAVLVEDSPTDYYWGCGADGSGVNRLGQILMSVRSRLKLLEIEPRPFTFDHYIPDATVPR